MLAVVVFVGYSASRQSEHVHAQATRAARSALATKLDQITRTAQDYAWWNDAVRHLDIEFDPAWADNNVGPYIYETFGYDVTFVIGRDDRTQYAADDGERRIADAFQMAPGLDRLVARARAIPPDQPGAASGYLEIEGAIAMVGASPIMPEPSDPIDVAPGPRPVLVYARRLDDDFLRPIAEGLGLHDLRLVGPRPAGDLMLPLTAPDGALLGGISWQLPRLGRDFIRDIAPSLVLAFGLIAGFAWLVLHHARRAARALEASEARFRDVAEASADRIWETNADGCLVFLSERFGQITKLVPQEFLARPVVDL